MNLLMCSMSLGWTFSPSVPIIHGDNLILMCLISSIFHSQRFYFNLSFSFIDWSNSSPFLSGTDWQSVIYLIHSVGGVFQRGCFFLNCWIFNFQLHFSLGLLQYFYLFIEFNLYSDIPSFFHSTICVFLDFSQGFISLLFKFIQDPFELFEQFVIVLLNSMYWYSSNLSFLGSITIGLVVWDIVYFLFKFFFHFGTWASGVKLGFCCIF